MPSKTIDQLIINSPYSEPADHWKYERETWLFSRVPGRRSAGYVRASDDSKLPPVNKIRRRVNDWREAGYLGVSGMTKRLLDHWNDSQQRLFFCQLEAIETLIWIW
jgi:type III restriction enzyme